MIRLIILFLLIANYSYAQTLLPFASGSASGGGGNTPTLIQHISSSTNPVGLGISGNNFKIPVSTVRSGNCLILAISYPNGSTPTVTDNNGNTWPGSPAVSKTGGSYTAAIFVLPNANAGAVVITVSFGSSVIPFNYSVSEFMNIATSSPTNGSIGATGAGPSLAAGSFTPTTNNDANGGNLIWSYSAISDSASSNPTSFSPGGSFSLLDGDITWTNNQGFPHSSQFFVQASQAAVNASVTATGDSSNNYNTIAVALKAASAGTAAPAGIRVAKILHFSNNTPHTTQTLQIPSTGNLRVLVLPGGPSISPITSVVDSESGSWTQVTNPGDTPYMFYRQNTSANNALTVTITYSGSQIGYSFRYFDIVSAAASSFDTSAVMSTTSVSNQSSVNNAPTITPTTSNGLVIAIMGIGQGPGLAVTSPSGGQWDLVTYTGETDLDLMENADALMHYYNATTSTINVNWTITSLPGNSAFATAGAFH